MLFVGIIYWVIFLKKNTKLFFKAFTVSLLCLLFFIGVGYFYLEQSFTAPTENKTESVPYYSQVPQNCGILFEIYGEKTFVYLDFENSKISSLLYPYEIDENIDSIYGYSIDYKISTNLDFIADLVDYLEGIELTIDNQVLRYTGVQVADIVLNDKEKIHKSHILKAITKKIAKNGIGKDMLLHIVENCDTNLTVPDFYQWPEHLKAISSNLQIIDN